jgi:ribosomal protein L34E
MNQGMRAFRMLVKNSTSVTCDSCGRELKGVSLPRLARRGCPTCGSMDFSFHGLPEAVARQFQRLSS